MNFMAVSGSRVSCGGSCSSASLPLPPSLWHQFIDGEMNSADGEESHAPLCPLCGSRGSSWNFFSLPKPGTPLRATFQGCPLIWPGSLPRGWREDGYRGTPQSQQTHMPLPLKVSEAASSLDKVLQSGVTIAPVTPTS